MTRSAALAWPLALALLAAAAPGAPRRTTQRPAAPAPAAAASPADVRARVAAAIAAPEFRGARVGVVATAVDTGEAIVSLDADRLFVPASNMKLYSTALALVTLGPAYRWRTSVYAAAPPDASGRVAGDLVLYGRGDPSLSGRFAKDNPLAAVDALAGRVAAAGVRRVTGDLVADESYFAGERFGDGWEWNDLQWRSGAEVSALTVDDNVVTLRVAPGPRPGEPCMATITPATPFVRLASRAMTVAKDGTRWVGVHRPQASNDVEVWGTLPAGGDAFVVPVAVHDPAAFFGELFRAALARRGVTVDGRVVSVGRRERASRPFDPAAAAEIAWFEGEPLAAVVRETNKESQNLYAELLLRAAGRAKGDPGADSDDAGLALLAELLRRTGTDPATLVLADGSGLSKRNLVTPAATVRLISYLRTQPAWPVFFDSLPVAGVDGTLDGRFKGSPAAGRLRAKTGTVASTSTLSGLLTTRTGRVVVFSIMVNNQPAAMAPARKAVDEIAAALGEL